MKEKKPNYFHECDSTVLYRGKPHRVHSRKFENGVKYYRLYSKTEDPFARTKGSQSEWIKEYNLMKHYPPFVH